MVANSEVNGVNVSAVVLGTSEVAKTGSEAASMSNSGCKLCVVEVLRAGKIIPAGDTSSA